MLAVLLSLRLDNGGKQQALTSEGKICSRYDTELDKDEVSAHPRGCVRRDGIRFRVKKVKPPSDPHDDYN